MTCVARHLRYRIVLVSLYIADAVDDALLSAPGWRKSVEDVL